MGKKFYLDSVPHHGHFVESGLSVEHNDVPIAHVSFHSATLIRLHYHLKFCLLVSRLQMQISSSWMVAQIDAIAVVANDVLCTGVLSVATVHQVLQPEKYT